MYSCDESRRITAPADVQIAETDACDNQHAERWRTARRLVSDVSNRKKGKCAMGELLTLRETADRLGFHPGVVRRAIIAGDLPGLKIRGRYRIDASELRT